MCARIQKEIETLLTMLAAVVEPVSNGAGREGNKVLERSGLRGGGSDNDSFHGVISLRVLVDWAAVEHFWWWQHSHK